MSVVDCHAHALPSWVQAAFHTWLDDSGSQAEGPRSLWASPAFTSVERHLASMDDAGIDTAVLTFSSNAITAMHNAAHLAPRPLSGPQTIGSSTTNFAAGPRPAAAGGSPRGGSILG